MARRDELPVSAEIEAEAEGLSALQDDGGPLVLLPNPVRARWRGMEEGGHFDLAWESRETFVFEGMDAFSLPAFGGATLWPQPDGLVVPRWLGGSSTAAAVAVAAQMPYAPVLRAGAPLYFYSNGQGVTLQRAEDLGDAPATEPVQFMLSAGHYAVEQIDVEGVPEWRGPLRFASGTIEKVIVRAYRFRQVSTAVPGGRPPGTWIPTSQEHGMLKAGHTYEVIAKFVDYDRKVHAVGDTFEFLGSSYLPYHGGISFFVSYDGERHWHIRMQDGENARFLANLETYLVDRGRSPS